MGWHGALRVELFVQSRAWGERLPRSGNLPGHSLACFRGWKSQNPFLINDRESREEGWVYGIRSARPADQIGFSGGAGVTIDCAASLAQVIRGAIELGTSLSSPLRLELAGNRTSSGHTVSQNRSRPEDHLTLALAFC